MQRVTRTEEARLRVALDAMGGDHAPRELVTGAVAAARDLGVEVVLVGPAARIRDEVQAAGGSGLPIRVLDAPEVIGMAEAPATIGPGA